MSTQQKKNLLTIWEKQHNLATSIWCENAYFIHISNRENEFKCKTVLIRKVKNFIEKNACWWVYTGHASCSTTWTSYYILICWPWIHFGLQVKQTKVASDSVYGRELLGPMKNVPYHISDSNPYSGVELNSWTFQWDYSPLYGLCYT